MQAIELTQAQRLAIFEALRPFAARFEAVGVYGSRVTGRASAGSDVDLVIYGAADAALAGDLAIALAESDLSIFADVVSFEHIASQTLRDEISRDALILHYQDDLAVGKAATR